VEHSSICLYPNNFVHLVQVQPIAVPKARVKKLRKMMKEELVIIQISHGSLHKIEHPMGGGIYKIEGTEEILYVHVLCM